jgi:hypothetical protein
MEDDADALGLDSRRIHHLRSIEENSPLFEIEEE